MAKTVFSMLTLAWLLPVAFSSAEEKKPPPSKGVNLRGLEAIASVLADGALNGRTFFARMAILEALKERTYSSKMKSEARPEQPQAKNALRVSDQKAVFKVEPTRENWRGNVTVSLDIPYMIHYEVDLNEIRQEDVRWDAKNHRLHVRMPKATVGPIEFLPHDPDVKKEVTYTRGRFKILDSEVEDALTDAAQKDGVVLARNWAVKNLREQPYIQQFAQDAVRKNIGLILKAVVPDAELILYAD